MFNEILLVSAAGLLLARVFLGFVCGSFMVSFCKNVQLLFLRIPLFCGTPDDPPVAPVEAGPCERGWERGGGRQET